MAQSRAVGTSRLAASRDGRELSSTVRAPCAKATRSASRLSASPTPLPRAATSTATSSIHARVPVGIRKTTRVSMPMIRPVVEQSRATRSVVQRDSMISRTSSTVGAEADVDSCRTRLPIAAINSSSTLVASTTLTESSMSPSPLIGLANTEDKLRASDTLNARQLHPLVRRLARCTRPVPA